MSDKNDPRMESPMEPISEDQHVRLCAYAFGELEGEERGAFEAELQRSPALRAEHERLLATVGLVRSALPAPGLSDAVRRDVVASARRSRFKARAGRRLLQLVAASVVVAGGALALRQSWRTPPTEHGALVARAPAPHSLLDQPALERESGFADEARGISSESRAKQSEGAPVASAAADSPYTPPAEPAADETVLLRSLAYSGNDGNDRSIRPRTTTSLGQEQANFDKNGFFLGQGEKKQGVVFSSQAPSSADPRIEAVLVAGGAGPSSPGPVSRQYRGPGDSAPGATPAWKGPEASAPLRKEAPRELAFDVSHELDALGYVGGDDEEALEEPELGLRARVQPFVQPRTREQILEEVDKLLASTRPVLGESARDMFFRYWGDAPFVPAFEESTSTFAVDVDTASYALTRAYLNGGSLPPREAVRTEEFVNYFRADQPPPTDGKPFAIGLELAPSPFARDPRTEMLRITVRGKDVEDFQRQPVALTFVIDNSGSMGGGGRLELVKRSLSLLLRQLYPSDSVAVVKFSNSAQVLVPMTPLTRRGEVEAAIQALGIEGGTNVEGGLRLGYEEAQRDLTPRTVHRVILCSDGVGNIGETKATPLLELVKEARAKGIYLNTVGVGMGNHNDAFLEELADRGDGVCNYVDSDAEAKRVFVDGLSSALQPIARDVKIQVEFDPAQVESWRLLGYENRALRNQDFRNDKVDAGEVNAGHQVTALYELVRLPSRSTPLATVRLRYKPPFAIDAGKEGERARAAAEEALEIERPLQATSVLPGFQGGTNGYQRAVLVAQFAEVLRQSVHARGDSFARLLAESRRLEPTLGDPDFTEFVALLAKANPLLDARAQKETPHVQVLLDELAMLHYQEELRARKAELARQAGEPEADGETREREAREARTAQERIRELEAAVRAEVLGASGFQPDARIQDIGYGGEEKDRK